MISRESDRARISAWVQEQVAIAPPLTEGQAHRLRQILNGVPFPRSESDKRTEGADTLRQTA